MTLADQILAFDDRPKTPVEAWGQKLFIVPMSGTDRDSYDRELHRAAKSGNELENWRSRFLVRCLCDEHGGRIFRDDQAEDLGRKDGETIRRLFQIADSVNETGPGAEEQAAKNSSAAPSDSSG